MRTHSEILALAVKALCLDAQATKGPWQVRLCSKKHHLFAPEPWREQFVRGLSAEPAKLADVAVMSGGQWGQAKDNAEFVAFARTAITQLADGYLALSRELAKRDGDPILPGDPLREERQELIGPGMSWDVSTALLNYLGEVFDAIDRLFGALDLPTTDEKQPPVERVAESPAEDRELRAGLLMATLALLQKSRPTPTEFYELLPAAVKAKIELHPRTPRVF